MKSTSATAAFTVSKATFAASDVLKTQSSETSFFASVLKTETEMLQKREAGLHFTARHVTKKHKTRYFFLHPAFNNVFCCSCVFFYLLSLAESPYFIFSSIFLILFFLCVLFNVFRAFGLL